LSSTYLSAQTTDTIIYDYLDNGDSSFIKRIGFFENKKISFKQYFYKQNKIGKHKRYARNGNLIESAIYSRDSSNNFHDHNNIFYSDDSVAVSNICAYNTPIKASKTDVLISKDCLNWPLIEKNYSNGAPKIKIEPLDSSTLSIKYFDNDSELIVSRVFINKKNTIKNIWIEHGLSEFVLDKKGNKLRVVFDMGIVKQIIFIPSNNDAPIELIEQISNSW